MILQESIYTKWNSKTKKYYEDLGYVYTKMGDTFIVKVEHLKPTSYEKVKIKCDYCGKEYVLPYVSVTKQIGHTHSCKKCSYEKTKETCIKKYGYENPLLSPEIQQKIKNTNLKKYGVENPFSSEEIKNKIQETNVERYGVKSPLQNKSILEKVRETCFEKYGETSHMKTKKYRDMFSGENSPVWKGGKNDIRWDRMSPKYNEWREFIYNKNHYTCQRCKKVGGNLECHHIFNYKDYPEKKYDKDNGITFCRKCHNKFHKIYGKRFNNKNQLEKFLNKDE